MRYLFNNAKELFALCEQEKMSISEVVLHYQSESSGKSIDELKAEMSKFFAVMEKAIKDGLAKRRLSLSGLTAGYAPLVQENKKRVKCLDEMGMEVMARALAVAENNATFGKIVAAPTAGSAGILPAVITTLGSNYHYSRERMVMALFTAAGLGMIIARQTPLSGAKAGCQAEVGSATAMAAAAAVELCGGSPEQCIEAAALALKNSLGLACDPVAGLVEVPCVKRNALFSLVALGAASLTLAGVKSAIPLDEVIQALAQIGELMPVSLKETAQGGLAATPTARQVTKKMTKQLAKRR